ncbi:unnamed protein product [Urochloa decumbens]|uniref:F-box domain-containing protein n=1 Tax=Urochloa decumbens TaxID=240449 RepID=A0ABC9BNB9_9POAL
MSTSCLLATAAIPRATSHLLSELPDTTPKVTGRLLQKGAGGHVLIRRRRRRVVVQMIKRRPTSKLEPPPASLPDNEDILRDILLRLPPLPSSLPRASLVSKLWHRIVSDPGFRRRFRAHHHKAPPLLGFFSADFDDELETDLHVFTPTLRAPDRIPPARFSCPSKGSLLGFRHGLALLKCGLKAIVWDPVTNYQCSVDFPPEFNANRQMRIYFGAVMRDDSAGSNSFKLLMLFHTVFERTLCASVYESELGKWGEIISTQTFSDIFKPSVMVGNKLYFLILYRNNGFLQFDLDNHSMAVIQMSKDIPITEGSDVQALRTQDGGLGFAVVSKHRMQLWGKTVISGDNVVRGELHKTIELDQLLSLRPSTDIDQSSVIGYDEVSNMIFIWTTMGVFMIQLESMKFTKVCEDTSIRGYFPFASFYPC